MWFNHITEYSIDSQQLITQIYTWKSWQVPSRQDMLYGKPEWFKIGTVLSLKGALKDEGWICKETGWKEQCTHLKMKRDHVAPAWTQVQGFTSLERNREKQESVACQAKDCAFVPRLKEYHKGFLWATGIVWFAYLNCLDCRIETAMLIWAAMTVVEEVEIIPDYSKGRFVRSWRWREVIHSGWLLKLQHAWISLFNLQLFALADFPFHVSFKQLMVNWCCGFLSY